MKAIVDTHALIWFLEENRRLGKKARDILSSSTAQLIIPVIVLCELYYYLRKKKIADRYVAIYRSLTGDPRISIKSLEAHLISKIPEGLELHDGLIAALASEMEFPILSRDEELQKWDASRLIWE